MITTTREDANKDYIGNAARHAELAVVFAQLEVGGESHGVHAFVVPIREAASRCARRAHRGRRAQDGPQRRRQRQAVVRRGAGAAQRLLNRFADVSADGVYSSDIENPNRRFFTMLGTLVQGRVCVGGAGINATKVALTIATKYALQRRQFGRPARRGGAAPRLRDAPAPAVAADRAHLRAALRPGGPGGPAAGRSPGATDDEKTRRELESEPPAPRRGAPGTPPTRSRSAARLRGRGLPRREPVRRAEGRH